MTRGIPLTDADRGPWLNAIRSQLENVFDRSENLVVACSALKQRYRDFLSARVPVIWVYLRGTEDVIRLRLQHRQEHFMKAQMLASQFADLEEPSSAIVVDVLSPPDLIVQQILAALQKRTTESHAA